jgi:hypothetical protein
LFGATTEAALHAAEEARLIREQQLDRADDAAVRSVSVAAITQDAERQAEAAQRQAEEQMFERMLLPVAARTAQTNETHTLGQHAAIARHAQLDAAQFERQLATELHRVQRLAALDFDLERLTEASALAERVEQAQAAAADAHAQHIVTERRRVCAEAQLSVMEARAAAQQTAAKAAILEAEQRAAQTDHELAVALQRMREYELMPDALCAIGTTKPWPMSDAISVAFTRSPYDAAARSTN